MSSAINDGTGCFIDDHVHCRGSVVFCGKLAERNVILFCGKHNKPSEKVIFCGKQAKRSYSVGSKEVISCVNQADTRGSAVIVSTR